MLSSPKTTVDTLEYHEASENSKVSSNMKINDIVKSQEEFLGFTVRRILPPVLTVKSEDNSFQLEDDEVDLYNELNNKKYCNIQ